MESNFFKMGLFILGVIYMYITFIFILFLYQNVSKYACLCSLELCTLVSPVTATKAGDLATLAGNLSLSLVH